MNRFQEAGLRALRTELINKGAPEKMWFRCTVPEGTAPGAVMIFRHWVVIALEDRGEDGRAEVEATLDPVAARVHIESGFPDHGKILIPDGPFRTEAPRT